MTYAFTTGGVDRSTISSLQVDAQAWTDVASNDTVFLQMWDSSAHVWVGLGDFQGRTTPWTYSVGSAAAICPGQGPPCPDVNTVVLRWYFLSANIQLLNVDYMRVSLFDTRSNQDVVTSAFQKDIRYDRAVPSAGAQVTAYVSSPISSAGSCITDGSGSCVLNLALNQYDFWAMTADSGYGMSTLNVTSNPYLALDATIGMVPPSTSTTVLEGTNTSYVEPLFQVTLDKSNIGGVGASVENTPFYNLTQLSSRHTFTSSSPLVYWSNVSIVWYWYWWDSRTNRMWLDQNPDTGDWYRQYRYGSDSGAPVCNNPYKYDTSQASSTFCYSGWNSYDPWYPGGLGGLLQIAVHGDCYNQNIRTYCENAQPGYDAPYSFSGITKLLQQSNSTFRGVIAYGYGYVGKSDPLRYALDTVASQMFTAFDGIQKYYGDSSTATTHINSVYSTLQTPSSTQSFASSSLRLYYGNYPSSFVATIIEPTYVLSTSHMAISTAVVPDPYFAFISSKGQVQPTDFSYVSGRSRANVEDYLGYTNFKNWTLSDFEVNSLTVGLSNLPQYLSNQIIYGSILASLSAKTSRVAVTPTLYNDPGATWNWTTWYRAGVVQTLASSSVVSAPAYEPDIFERNIQSYVQGLKRGSFLKNNFIPATLYPVAIVNSGAVINYTYRVDYEDVPSGLWITSLERVQADGNGNCVGLDNRAYQGTSQHSINQLVYHSFAKLDIGVDLVAFAGEHISAHNAGWTQYRFFMESPGRGHYKLSFYTKGFSATLSVLSAAFLAYNVYIDVGMASDQPVPETVVSFAQDASGFAEIALKLLKFGKITGPLGVFTLGFSIGYTIGEALGLGILSKTALGIGGGLALIVLVYSDPEFFVIVIATTAVIAYILSLFGW